MPMSSKPSGLLFVTMDVTEDEFDALISDRPWSPMSPDLEELIRQLPEQQERCTRTSVLAWAHAREGLIGLSQIYRNLTGYKDVHSARKHTGRILRLMVRQGLLKEIHFTADAPRHASSTGLNEGSAFEMTGAGVVYLRGAMLARQRLARHAGLQEAHRVMSEEEDDGRSHEEHYLTNVTIRDAGGKASTTRNKRLLNSVFGLAAA